MAPGLEADLETVAETVVLRSPHNSLLHSRQALKQPIWRGKRVGSEPPHAGHTLGRGAVFEPCPQTHVKATLNPRRGHGVPTLALEDRSYSRRSPCRN